MSTDRVQFPYKEPRFLDDNLWVIDGTWRNKLGRRMTVLRTGTGKLVVHNPMKLLDKELSWLNTLGSVEYLIAPNKFHTSDLQWMAQIYPRARLIVPSKLKKALERARHNVWSTTEADGQIEGEIILIPVPGTRVEELAVYYKPSRTLVLCDLAFNMENVFRGVEAWLMKLNKVGGRFGPSELFRIAITKNRLELLEAVDRLASLGAQRIIVNHGEIYEGDGNKMLRQSFREIFADR